MGLSPEFVELKLFLAPGYPYHVALLEPCSLGLPALPLEIAGLPQLSQLPRLLVVLRVVLRLLNHHALYSPVDDVLLDVEVVVEALALPGGDRHHVRVLGRLGGVHGAGLRVPGLAGVPDRADVAFVRAELLSIWFLDFPLR